MFHKTIIIGRVGRDPEMRYTPSGKQVTSFSVACQDGFGDNKKTVWYNVSSWNKLAETCNKYVKKGALVMVEGRMIADDKGGPRVWTDNSGNPKASFEINANEVRFLSKVEVPDIPDAGDDLAF